MRYVGIDYGRKRIGIAFSDEEGKLAFPRGVVRDAKGIAALVKKEKADKIIVGLPTSFDGNATEQTREIYEFVEELKKKVVLPIEFENEMLSTRLVKNEGVAKEHRDESAAAVILQSYLDKHNLRGT